MTALSKVARPSLLRHAQPSTAPVRSIASKTRSRPSTSEPDLPHPLLCQPHTRAPTKDPKRITERSPESLKLDQKPSDVTLTTRPAYKTRKSYEILATAVHTSVCLLGTGTGKNLIRSELTHKTRPTA